MHCWQIQWGVDTALRHPRTLRQPRYTLQSSILLLLLFSSCNSATLFSTIVDAYGGFSTEILAAVTRAALLD